MHGKPFIYWLLRFLMKNKVNKFILCSDTNYKSIENLINIIASMLNFLYPD